MDEQKRRRTRPWPKVVAAAAMVVVASATLPAGASVAFTSTPWCRLAGGAGADFANDVALDAAGNSYVVGTFEQTAAIGTTSLASHGETDLYVAKYDAGGTFRWVRQIGSALADRAAGVVVLPSGRVVVAGTGRANTTVGTIGAGGVTLPSYGGTDAFLVAFMLDGSFAWGATEGGAGWDEASALSTDEWGRIAITGSFTQSATFGTSVVLPGGSVQPGSNPVTLTAKGLQDAYAASFDTTGQVRWAQDVAAGGSQDLGAAIVGIGGRMIVAGTFQGSTKIGATQVYAADLNAAAAYVASLSNDTGAVVWVRLLRGSTSTSASPAAFAASPSGDVVLVGAVNGPVNFLAPGQPSQATVNAGGTIGQRSSFVLRMGQGGAYRWAAIGAGTDTNALDVAVDSTGDIYAVGSFSSTTTWYSAPETAPASFTTDPAGMRDGFIAHYTPWGNIRRVETVSGSGEQTVAAISADTGGGARIAGLLGGTTSFPGGTVIGSSSVEGFVARVSPA